MEEELVALMAGEQGSKKGAIERESKEASMQRGSKGLEERGKRKGAREQRGARALSERPRRLGAQGSGLER